MSALRSWGLAGAVLGLTLLVGKGAAAQVAVERLEPAVTWDGFVTTEGSAVRPEEDRFAFSFVADYAHHPLVIGDADGNYVDSVVSHRVGMQLAASATLVGPLALGVGLPAFVAQDGAANPSGAGLGKLRLVPKLRLLDDRESLGLALLAEVRAPTNTGDFSGTDGFEVVPKVAVDHRFRSGIRVGFNVGAVLREKSQVQNVSAGSELAYAAALGYRFGGNSGKTEVGVEAVGAFGLSQLDREEAPLEGLGYVKHDLSYDWQLLGGAGVGVLPGYGVPLFRVFAGVGYTPTSHDEDHDGISDSKDQCPDIAEDRDGYQDADGCPEEDPDSDHDGVSDFDDKCPNQPETINGIEDSDGCPDDGNASVIFEDGELTMVDTIQFAHGSAQLEPKSKHTLDQVAQVILAHPEVNVTVEGHTDDTGTRETNLALSKYRAETVRSYLIGRGVSPKRVSAVGIGPDRPLVQGTSDEARAKNRRVEFLFK